jgi:hypothetical protein
MTIETALTAHAALRLGHGIVALGAIGPRWSHVTQALPVLFLIAFGVALWRTLFPRTQR